MLPSSEFLQRVAGRRQPALPANSLRQRVRTRRVRRIAQQMAKLTHRAGSLSRERGQAELKSDSPKLFPGAAASSAGGILSD